MPRKENNLKSPRGQIKEKSDQLYEGYRELIGSGTSQDIATAYWDNYIVEIKENIKENRNSLINVATSLDRNNVKNNGVSRFLNKMNKSFYLLGTTKLDKINQAAANGRNGVVGNAGVQDNTSLKSPPLKTGLQLAWETERQKRQPAGTVTLNISLNDQVKELTIGLESLNDEVEAEVKKLSKDLSKKK